MWVARTLASVTVESRDPASSFSRDDFWVGRASRRLRPRANGRRKEKASARRNARGRFADTIRNAEAERDSETGEAQIEVEKEDNADAHAEAKSKKNSGPR